MNRSKEKPPQTKRRRMAKLLEKGRSEHEPLGTGPWSRLAGALQVCRRKLQEDAGLVMTHERVNQLIERESKQREP